MKKVRLAAVGIAGVLPTLGLMAQPTADAAVRAPMAKGKTITMLDPRAVYDGGCVGTNYKQTGSNPDNSSMHFWWKDDNTGGHSGVCIGTVVRVVNALGDPGGIFPSSYVRYRIYSSGAQYPAYSYHYYGSPNGKITFSRGVHEAFSPKPVLVCTAIVAPGETYGYSCAKVG